MSELSPKKLKQTEISSPKKETATDSECRDNVQEAEVKTHNLQYCFNTFEKFSVSCKASMTVLEALDGKELFKIEKEKKKNKQKEILIQRLKEGFPRAAVKTNFPCCLIETDEILKIDFIQKEQNSSPNRTTADPSLRKTSNLETLVSFWVKKEGGQKVQSLLKSKALRGRVQYVCVYAFKGEEIKTALKRDGRFKNIIFKKHCALLEFNNELKHEFSNPVDILDRKSFQVVVVSDTILPDSQDDLTPVKTEPNVASDADVAETDGSGQNPISTEQEKKQDGNTKSTNPTNRQYATKPIADSEEILGILRNQFPVLLKQLKQREKLKSKSDVQKFFRAEYGKSVENFLKVKNVKQLMKLSDSVCQIRQRGSARGTGFLLFDKYVLTNAHVIGISADLTNINFAELTAIFDYEDMDSGKCIQIKQLTDYSYRKDEQGRHLDYALLELDDNIEIAKYHRLLDYYSPILPTNTYQICIVGHPGEGVKTMDPCITIGTGNREEAVNKHKSENADFINLMTQKSLEEKWDFHKNQITYNSCFYHGSSGSPVFDADCKLIGIHTGGYVYDGKGKTTQSIMEYAYSMQPILNMIRAQAKIKGLHEIVKILQDYSDKSNVSGTAVEENQTYSPMDIDEKPE